MGKALSLMGNTNVPNHLITLPDNSWATWRWILLRSAGFPTSQALALANTDCAELADEYVKQNMIVQKEQDKTKHFLWQKLKDANPIERASIRNSIHQLCKGIIPSNPSNDAIENIIRYREANEKAEELKSRFQDAFQKAICENTRMLRNVADDARFREAIIWQNRLALQTGLNQLLKTSVDNKLRSASQRKHEYLIASYLQRYCMKNDTIGFFGPVAWTHVIDQESTINIQNGDSLIANRNIYFELWGMDAIAQMLGQNEALLPWCSPRRLPLFDIEGESLHRPLAPVTKLTPAQATVLKHCDGELTAKQIAAQLIKDGRGDLKTEVDVYKTLSTLQALHLIKWTLEIPSTSLYPEKSLRQRLDCIGDEFLRQQALEILNRLEDKRHSIVESESDVEKLNHAFGELEETFTSLTGTAATRHAGQTYAARTLLYEDCSRNTTVSVSPKLISCLGISLTLLLVSARWFSFKAAAIYRKAFKGIYTELVQQTGSSVVNFASIWIRMQSILFGADTRLLQVLERELQKRWLAILKFTEQQHRVQYTASDLREEVLKVFNAPCPGWKTACYHSPDLMIAATSLNAIHKGDYLWVLGELHPTANTLTCAGFVAQHPFSRDLFQALEVDLPSSQVRLVASREKVTPRRAAALFKSNDYRFIVSNDSCGVPSSQALLVGTLVAEEIDGDLVVRRRDGSLHFEIIEFMGDVLSFEVIHHFNFIPQTKHTPRIAIDCLVIHRETWHFIPEDISFAFQKNASERFVQARQWAVNQELPRFLFVKTPIEVKPLYVDLASPISVDLFAKAIRRAHATRNEQMSIEVTEMLPDPYQTWLIDNEGNRYTSEFRIVAVDRGQNSA